MNRFEEFFSELCECFAELKVDGVQDVRSFLSSDYDLRFKHAPSKMHRIQMSTQATGHMGLNVTWKPII